MIETKIFEIRDVATTCVALCTRVPSGTVREQRMFRHQGFGHNLVNMQVLNKDMVTHDPFKWGDRTFKTAHMFIQEKWTTLSSTMVIDVQYILGETNKPKESDIFK